MRSLDKEPVGEYTRDTKIYELNFTPNSLKYLLGIVPPKSKSNVTIIDIMSLEEIFKSTQNNSKAFLETKETITRGSYDVDIIKTKKKLDPLEIRKIIQSSKYEEGTGYYIIINRDAIEEDITARNLWDLMDGKEVREGSGLLLPKVGRTIHMIKIIDFTQTNEMNLYQGDYRSVLDSFKIRMNMNSSPIEDIFMKTIEKNMNDTSYFQFESK